jgi:hypothetical protein
MSIYKEILYNAINRNADQDVFIVTKNIEKYDLFIGYQEL